MLTPVFKAMRFVGQHLDFAGRMLEVNPWVDKCKLPEHIVRKST